ncbi:type II toxin-antitoxin system HicA family toxin [Verrucomicrobiales bacterium]|nr:type II toxin-antitoxin system HicA family toxin [Verrucomicrobiales bacterium]
MKRSKLERHLKKAGCQFELHGGNHDIWVNPANGAESPVPRHNEIKKWTARGICRQLGVEPPTGE